MFKKHVTIQTFNFLRCHKNFLSPKLSIYTLVLDLHNKISLMLLCVVLYIYFVTSPPGNLLENSVQKPIHNFLFLFQPTTSILHPSNHSCIHVFSPNVINFIAQNFQAANSTPTDGIQFAKRSLILTQSRGREWLNVATTFAHLSFCEFVTSAIETNISSRHWSIKHSPRVCALTNG